MLRDCYISDLKENEKVWIAGWVHEIRDIGKIVFLILRDKTGKIQAIAKKKEVSDDVLEKMKVLKETVVRIYGTTKKSDIAKSKIEFLVEDIEILGQVLEKLPVDPTQEIISELETRLNYRYLDLRCTKPKAIFKIKSIILNSFRNLLLKKNFQEINPTCIVSSATEGGTDLFEIKYFEKKAYLAQSPQLYKQFAVIGGFDRVFMTSPVFRAEKHNTTTHLNEVLQMDIEMGFANDEDVMDVLEEILINILKDVKNLAEEELKILEVDLKIPEKIPRFTYSYVVEKLKENKIDFNFGDDFSKEIEKKLDEILDCELYFITKWPTKIRAFYSMPTKENKEICKAFDLIYKGLEISSGAQRIHEPKLLKEALISRDLNIDDFKIYIDAFKMGAPPHSGWSIGLERLTMKICNVDNIRECSLFVRDRTRISP